MIGAVLLAHLVGDYLIQSDWMAREKIHRWWPALVHGATYTLPFLLITTDWRALAVIAGTHVVIDRWRLARYVIWLRNWLAPLRFRRSADPLDPPWVFEAYNPPWSECRGTGFPSSRPAWLAVWLMFIADNTVHLLINVAAVRAWGG